MSFYLNRQYPFQSLYIFSELSYYALSKYRFKLAKILSTKVIVLEKCFEDYFIVVGMCILLASRSQGEC